MLKLISLLNNVNSFEIVKTNSIIKILDNLELKGFIKYIYNPYNNKIIVYNNKIQHIKIISKSSRKIMNNTIGGPYKMSNGEYILNNNKQYQNNELLVYVE